LLGPLYLFLLLVGIVPAVYLLTNAYLSRRRDHARRRVEVSPSDVTAVVPVRNQVPALFRASIASIAQQGCRLVVVGDGCIEPYRSVTESFGGTFHELEVHVGKKRALAVGLAEVRTPFVLFVDSDTLLPPDAVRSMASRFVPEVGGVGANLTVLDTGTSAAYCGEFVERAREVVLRAMSSRGSVLYLDGACAMYRTDLIRPFVESSEFQDLRVLGRPRALGDDWQLTDHVLKSGFQTVKAYDVSATTSPKATLSSFVRQNVRWSRSNWVRLGSYLAGRGPRNRGAFFTFEVLGTYALPLVAFATLLSRLPLLVHLAGNVSSPLEFVGVLLLHSLFGISRGLNVALLGLSMTLLGSFATGVFLGTIVRGSHRPTVRMLAYGALGTAVLFVTAIYGLLTFWKRSSWGEAAPNDPAEIATPRPTA